MSAADWLFHGGAGEPAQRGDRLAGGGKLADLVVLDRDPFAVPATELSSVQVRATFADGSLVHGAC